MFKERLWFRGLGVIRFLMILGKDPATLLRRSYLFYNAQ